MKQLLHLPVPALLLAACLLLAGWAGKACAQGVTIALTPATLSVLPDSTFYLDITVSQAGSAFNAFDTMISFDSGAVTAIPLSPLSQQEGSIMKAACSNRFHRFHYGAAVDTVNDGLLCNGVSVTGPGQIYHLKFQAAHLDQYTEITFLTGKTHFYANGVYVNPVATSSALVTIGDPAGVPPPSAGPGRPFLRIVPNPATEKALFDLGPGTGGVRRITVSDVLGRVVRRFEDSVATGQVSQILWDGLDSSGGKVPVGVYFVTLQAGGQSCCERLSLIR
jgi:hypothetical protein